MSSISGRSARSSASSGGRRSTTMPTYSHQHPAPPRPPQPHSASLELGRRTERLTPRQFLDKYSLPRVVRVAWGGWGPLSQPLLLYRQYRSAKVQAHSVAPARAIKLQGPGLVVPASYSGWFSRVNSKGQPTARCYTSVQQLVQAQITAFVPRNDLTAYKLSDTKEIIHDTANKKLQYLKTNLRAGHVIKMLAVFEDVNNVPVHSNKRLSLPLIGRASSKGDKYAQCLDDKNQMVFIPVTTTGHLFAVCSDDAEAACQLPQLLRDAKFPMRVCLIAGPPPSPLPAGFTGNLLLENCQQEDVILSCTLPPDTDVAAHGGGGGGGGQAVSQFQPKFLEIDADSQFLLSRPLLHHDTESRMFKSPLLQSSLAFCREHGDRWRRQIKVTHHIFPAPDPLPPPPPPPTKPLPPPAREKAKARQATKKSASFTYTPAVARGDAPPAVPPRNESRTAVRGGGHPSDELPYSHVADAIADTKAHCGGGDDDDDEENIYAEICEPKNPPRKFGTCRAIREDYYYVQLEGGSDNSSVEAAEVTYDTVC